MRNVTHLNELVRLLNWGYKDNKEVITVNYSKFFSKVLEQLVLAGLIKSFQVNNKQIQILLGVSLSGRKGRFIFKNISLPGILVVYSLAKLVELKRKRPDLVLFLYTSEGILTNSRAIEKRIGGKALFEVL